MLAAAGMFSLMDTAMKLLSETYPAMQVTALRALSSLPLVCLYLLYRGAFKNVLKVRWPLHVFRGVLGILMITLFAYGLKRLSLAEAYSLFFIAPLLITALSVFILKEKVDLARWCAIAVGLGGVLVVLRPEGGDFLSLAGLAVLAAAACYAVSAITGRILSRTDASESMVFWLMIMMAAGGVALCWHEWVAIRREDWLLLAGLSVSGFLGQLAITEAFRSGKASSVAPFEYSALAWGMSLDWLLWRTLPDEYTLVGAAIIIASGIYLVRKEAAHMESEHP
ncbi:DMT family transporter [Janthinobacterium sp.]|uniref:DMT family transporter n=1 Tax=Janthinobacterium sp. TaxID=1871054 RepID=UPI0028972BEA|nr:DMT family transporter [Janthinobacterium sp.]